MGVAEALISGARGRAPQRCREPGPPCSRVQCDGERNPLARVAGQWNADRRDNVNSLPTAHAVTDWQPPSGIRPQRLQRSLQSGPCDARAGLRAERKGWLPARS